MLHREIKQNVNVPPVAQPSTSAQALSSLNALTTQRRSIDNRHFGEVLLATALIKVVSHNGTVQLRALLDQGSQASFITEDAVQKLGLLKKTLRANVFGIGQACSQTTSGIVKAKILLNNGEFYNMEALVLPKLTNLVPNRYIQVDQLNNVPNVTLADPHINIPGKIDLLFGADTYAHLILADVISLEEGPLLQNTRLGWIISGSIGAAGCPLIQSFNIGLVENDDLGAQLKMFWELEEVTTKKQPKEDDIQAEEHYKNTVSRSNSGRYTVRLPFKNMKAKNELGRSRYSAVSSWKHMETRMEKNPSMKEEYVTCIQEYIDAGYLVPTEELVENSDSKHQGHYLAHHAVRKESTTTKTRIVFDASRKTNTGVSLNDVLLTGPVIQNDMLSVLIRFRTFKFAIVADIAKMFLQIKLHDDDTNYQRIVWRSSQQENIHDYRLTTVTFGLTCAPFLAIRTLHQLAIDEGANYPLAAESIKREFYVDDVLSGGHSIEEATQKRNELMNMLESGGFHLRKWMSNNRKLLDGIPTDDVESVDVLDLDLDIGYRSLGLLWHPTTDTFAYRIQTDNWKTEGECSKRSILSDIARLYDPFGWIAPVTVRAKNLMQALWKLGLNWDDSIPEDTLAEWMDITGNLKQLGSLRIRRRIDTYSDSTVTIHGFCDASLEAYAATIFIVTRRNNESKVHLVMAKTKVAPVQGETIPKLELCGALLLAKMIHQFKESFSTQLNITSTILWSDNETVLAWLRGHPSKWNIFVANRTAQIFENVGNTPWRYVPSADNPADLATRGLTTKQLMDSKLWWNGPSWLEHNEDQWPRSSRTPSTNLEKKRSTLKCFVSNLDTNFLASILSKFSSLTRLIRVTAFCIRFIRLASKQTDYKGYLTTSELHEARLIWIKFAQQIEFSPEIKSLQRNEDLPNTSKILCLNPIVKDGLLRATGRLDNSNLSDDEKHPLILPSKGTYTKLLLENIHKITLHGGTQLMLATLRKYYWVLNGRNAVKAVIHGCIACFRNRPKLSSQLMGSLPSPRVNISRPFLHVGIDYCGPFNIKDRTGRGAKIHKGYVAVFVCLAVKAIHIELVNDMTTQAFLAAFKRFVGRRGLCSDIYSDCGSNFIGADAELRRITKANNSVAELLANDGVTWHFNPPASPHFGGLWEAGVKSVKQHLHRTLQDTSLSYEELCTTLIQIEACLNSRPLCPMYDDPTDTTALTPGHFLIGDTLLHAPETNLLEEKMNRLDRWQLTQRLSQQFWKRWSQEYLARLQQRPKWLVRRPNPEVGDLCLIKDDRFPPYRWPLAKIIELHPGKDMLVRVVTVATNGTTLKRNITKIAFI